jgi:hypothetical protein
MAQLFKMAAMMELVENLLLADENVNDIIPLLLPEEREVTYDPTKKKFLIDDYTSAQCRAFFRFEKGDIFRLAEALRLPARFVLPNRCVVDDISALCIFLARLSYPNRLVSLENFFNRPKSTLSMIISCVLDHIYDNFSRKITDLDQPWLTDRFQEFADAIHDKGAPLQNCIGFIDGTVRPLCRPTHFQRICYNGHKRVHAIKFQSIVTPDGMMANLFGPVEGRRHDSFLLTLSGVLQQFEAGQWDDINQVPFCLYGDPAYPIRDFLIHPYRNAVDQYQQQFNTAMSSVRETVEWQFSKILQQFAFLDFKKNLKVFLQPVGKLYLVGGILVNCHTCLYGSQTSQYFNVDPPELEVYLE